MNFWLFGTLLRLLTWDGVGDEIMIRVAVIEDEMSAFKTLNGYLNKIQQETDVAFHVINYPKAEDFLYQNLSLFDIVFMDIELPGMNGMEAARKLRQSGSAAILLFVTNMAQYAVKGYEVDAIDFIVKPITYFDFAMKMQKVLRRVKMLSSGSISVSTKVGMKRILISEIKYVEVSGHHLIYHAESGDTDVCGSLGDLESQLGGAGFFRCNNCYLVNLAYVSELRSNEVVVGGEPLQISRPRRKEFLEALTAYLGS